MGNPTANSLQTKRIRRPILSSTQTRFLWPISLHFPVPFLPGIVTSSSSSFPSYFNALFSPKKKKREMLVAFCHLETYVFTVTTVELKNIIRHAQWL